MTQNDSLPKILHLSNNPEAYKFGGTEKFLINMITHLKSFDHIIIGGDLVCGIAQSLQIPSYNFEFKRGHGGFLFRIKEIIYFPYTILMSLYFVFKFRKLLSEVDIVSFSNGSKNSVITYAPLIKLFFNKPMIYIFHGIYSPNKFYNYSIFGKIWQFGFNLCTRVFITKAVEESVGNLKFTSNTSELIYNGTEINNYTAKDETKTYNFGYIGSLNEAKGIKTLIETLKIYDNPASINFYFKGEGPLLDEIKSIIGYNPLVNVIIEEFSTDTIPFYQNLDCLVVPSYIEGFGLVRIEAMERGVPVISSNIAALNELNEIINMNELIFKVGSSEDLLDKMEYFINNREVFNSDYRLRLHDSVAKFFDNKKQFQKYSDLFLKIINKNQN